jgi:uncharacterized protein (TIGR03086 family)
MDLLDAHGRAIEVFEHATHKVGLTDWDSPTPCADWSVRDLVNHIVTGQLWVPDLLAGHTVAEVGDKYAGDQLHDDPPDAWTEASGAARGAFLQPGALDRTVHLSFGDIDGREYCWLLTTDLAVHGWDLATALGADAGIDDELATTLLGYVEPKADSWSGSGAFGKPVPVSDDADPVTRLIGLLGRRP